MQVIGFDVGKDTIFGARLDASHMVKERFEITNETSAIEPVLMDLRRHYKRLLIGSEATGDYHRRLALTCLQLGNHSVYSTLLPPSSSPGQRCAR